MDSERRRRLAMLLYAAGYSRGKYHRDVLHLATEQNNTWALDAILFDVDPETGQRSPRVNEENLGLVKRLSARSRQPEIRLICAKCALAVQRPSLAEQICQELMTQRYKSPDSDRSTPDDHALVRARQNAMHFMFYDIRNERAFKLIFDLATLPLLEAKCMPPRVPPHGREQVAFKERGQGPIPPMAAVRENGTWVAFSSTVRGSMDVREAQSLVHLVETWVERKVIGSGDDWRLTAKESLYVNGEPNYLLLVGYEMYERHDGRWLRWGGRWGLFTLDEGDRQPKLAALLDQHGQPMPRPTKHEAVAPPKDIE